jgi:predicted Zn-dependent protease
MLTDFQRSSTLHAIRHAARRALLAGVSLGWLWLSAPAPAHEENSQVVEKLTEQIAAAPNDAELYLKRAEMQRLTSHWHAAEVDYARARQLAPDLRIIDLACATMWNDAGMPEHALPLLDRFIQHAAQNPDGYSERGRAKRILQQWTSAAADFSTAVKLTPQPSPENFSIWAATLEDGQDDAAALEVLSQGLARLGDIASLETIALNLEENSGQFDPALKRLEGMLERPGRKEALLVRKAAILIAAGRPAAARPVLELAQSELAALPEERRLSTAARKVAADIERMNQSLSAPTTTPNK